MVVGWLVGLFNAQTEAHGPSCTRIVLHLNNYCSPLSLSLPLSLPPWTWWQTCALYMHMWGKLEFKVQQTDNTTLSRFIITIRYRIPTTRQSSQAGINIVGDETNKHHQQHP